MTANNSRQRRPGLSMNAVTSAISTTLMLVLLGFVMFFVMFAAHFSDNMRENFTVSLILDDEMSQSQAYELQTTLRSLPCARHVEYISKERALKEQSEALGNDPSEFMEHNPMPASFEVKLKAEYANSDSLDRFLPDLQKNKMVLDVFYPKTLMDSLNDNIRRISTVLLIIGGLLTLISFVLINNTIRLSVMSRRFLIRTMTLVGASWGYIRRPFLRQALFIGLLSATVASAVLAVGLSMLIQQEPRVAQLVTWRMVLLTIGFIYLCGSVLTLWCAYFTVGKALRMSDSKIHRY